MICSLDKVNIGSTSASCPTTFPSYQVQPSFDQERCLRYPQVLPSMRLTLRNSRQSLSWLFVGNNGKIIIPFAELGRKDWNWGEGRREEEVSEPISHASTSRGRSFPSGGGAFEWHFGMQLWISRGIGVLLFKAYGFLSNGSEKYLESSEPLRSDARFPGPIKCTPLSLCGSPPSLNPFTPQRQ